MKSMRNLGVVCLSVILLAGSGAQANEELGGKAATLGIGLELLVSPGYGSFLDDMYGDEYDVSGGYGWLGLQIGVPIRVGDYVQIKPSLSGLFNGVVLEGGHDDDDSYVNYMIIPAVSAKVLTPGRNVRIYPGCELNYNIPETTSDVVEFSSGGVGGALFLGIEIRRHGYVELGYQYLPVDTMAGHYDFGGVMLRGGYAF